MGGLTNNEVKNRRWIGQRASCCEDSFTLKQREVSRIEGNEVRMFGMPLKSTIPEWVASQTMRSKIVDGLESVEPEHEEELLVLKTASL